MNNKGFAIAGLFYAILLVFLSVIILMLFNLQNKKSILDKLKTDTVSAVSCEANYSSLNERISRLESQVAILNSVLNGSGATKVAAQANDTHKGIVYLDPTDLTRECTSSNLPANASNAGTKTGCMKWYIYDDSGSNYKMILDHNTTATVAYDTSGTYKEYSNASIKTQVETDTNGWIGNPRLITANEVATIIGKTGWNSSTALGSQHFYFGSKTTDSYADQTEEQKAIQRKYAWLYDYTDFCTSYGCNVANNSTYGYWTSSIVSDTSTNAWRVDRDGNLGNYYVDSDTFFGIRPIITIPQSIVTS